MKRIGIYLQRVLLALLFIESVFAQATAQISGTVRDQTGAVLPGVEITATQSETVNLTGVAETPQFARPALRLLATGWRLSGIYRWDLGQPVTIVTGSDRVMSGVDVQRVNQVLGDVYLDKSARPSSQYFNPTAFAQPALGTLGNLRRGSLRGPANWSFDMALSRAFRVNERQRLEVRAEAYNVTNSFRPMLPSLSLATNTFGQIRSALDPRIMQFALKYIF